MTVVLQFTGALSAATCCDTPWWPAEGYILPGQEAARRGSDRRTGCRWRAATTTCHPKVRACKRLRRGNACVREAAEKYQVAFKSFSCYEIRTKQNKTKKAKKRKAKTWRTTPYTIEHTWLDYILKEYSESGCKQLPGSTLRPAYAIVSSPWSRP